MFDYVGVPDFDHSARCVVVSHCCFDLHFFDGIYCGAFFFRVLFAICISYEDMLLKIFGSFSNKVVCFLIAEP